MDADDIALMMHGSLLYGDWTEDDLICSQAAQEQFRTDVLSYRPPPDARPSARAAPAESEGEPPPLDYFRAAGGPC
jgi:hypothetical protein